MSALTIFSLDLGNKRTKMYTEKGVRDYPSQFALKKDAGQETRFKKKMDLNFFSINEEEYVWGNDLYEEIDPQDLIDTMRFGSSRYSSSQYKNLIKMSLAEMASDYDTEGILAVELVIALPTEDLTDENKSKLEKFLKDAHSIKRNGKSHVIKVDKVHIESQTTGTFYNHLLGRDGLVDNKELYDKTVSIVDAGGGTLIIETLKRLSFIPELSSQFETGAYKLFNEIKFAAKQKGCRISVYEIENILREGKTVFSENNRSDEDQVFDLSKIIEKVKNQYTEVVLNNLNKTLKGTNRIDQIIVTGGTSQLINKEVFKEEYPYVIFEKEPSTANAVGNYKYILAVRE
ncbi:plasmid segregation protein ParM domain-containing protein [Bacillus licheniformis]|uniref:ParM/StbA family protein n=1 Tax=Bacillus licheniformis TaxID=1402 RepID=UPI000926DE65|nr:plasmid segregation protein ParM domain-containing protein [Bacillus licheniformis]OJT70481.1 hypothetical protein BFP46_07850 [Bacillus licheniformis]